MKAILLVFFVFLSSFSCESVQLEEEIRSVEFSSMGMSGLAESVRITKDSIVLTYEKRRTQEPPQVFAKKLDRGEWAGLIQTIDKLDFQEVSALESPTNKRAYDGAYHSQLAVRTINQEYSSSSFDDENPHEKLRPLMEAVRALANTVDKED